MKLLKPIITIALALIMNNIYCQSEGEVNKQLFRKGSGHLALTANVDASNSQKTENLLVNIVKSNSNGFNFTVLGGYFVKDNFSVGGAFGYEANSADITFNTDGETNTRVQSADNQFNTTAFIRNFLPFGNENRFAIFNETDLSVGFGGELQRTTKSLDDISKQYANNYSVSLGLRPGVTFVIIKGFAFETSLNLLGFTYKRSNRINDGVDDGANTNSYKFNFDINLLSLNFGLAYYF